MRDKCAQTDIKLKHDSINIIAYRARHNEHVAPLELTPQVQRHVVPLEPTPRAGW
jgi:hypothetical protein